MRFCARMRRAAPAPVSRGAQGGRATPVCSTGRAHPELGVRAVPVADASVLDDVDTPDELARVEEAILRGR